MFWCIFGTILWSLSRNLESTYPECLSYGYGSGRNIITDVSILVLGHHGTGAGRGTRISTLPPLRGYIETDLVPARHQMTLDEMKC